MAKNKKKLAFGIFKDGLTIKIAQLTLENGIITIQRLEETTLSSALSIKESEENGETVLPLEQQENEIIIPELSDGEEKTFSLPEMSDYEDSDNFTDSPTDNIIPGMQELQNFLQEFPLERGKISFNADNDQISYFLFDSSFGTKNLHNRLLNELLSKKEIKAKNYSFDFILNPDKSGLAFVHKGNFNIFHALRDINLNLSKKKYFYSYIDTNEISLINIVNHNYDFSEDDYVLILYIGFDYKIGIILKNGMYIRSFPIIFPDTDEVSIRETIFSKILLEQDTFNITIKNILLAGDNTTDEDLKYFRSATQEDDNITRLDHKQLTVQKGMENKVTLEKIAKYAIPIELAYKTLDVKKKNRKTNKTNLLPNKVMENQKHFKIVWHGFLVLLAIFYFAFAGTIKNLELKRDIINYEKKNYQVEQEFIKNSDLIRKLNEIKDKINKLEEDMIKVEEITENKNQWNYILDVFSRSLNKNRLSWLNNISSSDQGFKIEGYTTNRHAIIVFSELFPESKITNISINDDDENEITIWKFNITSNYPDYKSLTSPEKEKTELEKPAEKTETEKITIEEVVEKPETVIITETSEEISKKYNTILSLYFSGKIDDAYNQFSEFVKDYPQHEMSYNAKYLIGECLYHKGRYAEAKKIFEMIYKLNGNKTPDALIMLGHCSVKENDLESAVQYWNTLIKKYPDNNLSEIAQKKIMDIKGIEK